MAITTAPSPSSAPAAARDKVLSRRQIEGLIADGRHIFILHGKVLKADAWIKFHPGGDKSIQHMVGRDATEEVNAYAAGKQVVYMHTYTC